MRRTITLGLLLAAAAATPAFAQSFVGEWTATAHLQGAESSEYLTVTKSGDGYAITGRPVESVPGAPVAGPGKDIVVNGNDFSYTRSVDIPNGSLTITYKGVVTGDAFTGTADVAGASVPYTGIRKATGQ